MSHVTVIRDPGHLESVTPERKGFVIASSILLLIELAGGHFQDSGTPFGTLKLDRPELLHTFLWAYLLFQALRYWQSIGSPSFGRFSFSYSRKVDIEIHKNKKYRAYVEDLLNGTEFVLTKNAPWPPLIRRGIFKRFIDFRRGWGHPSEKHPLEDRLPVFKLPFYVWVPLEIKAHLALVFLTKYWFDAILPWVLSICAIGLGIANALI